MDSEKPKSFLAKSNYKWDDLQPLPQYDSKPAVFNFQYPKEYEEIMGYFRAVVNNNEISERVFELTAYVVDQICGNYSAWFLRRKCLEKLQKDLILELDFIEKNFESNEKVYQIWEHRRWVIEKINKPLKEIAFIDSILARDNKNYHAWSYRKWLVEKFDLFESEILALDKFLEEDIRNNSAWNQRFFVCKHFISIKKRELKDEIKYCIEKLKISPDNESGWNYLNGWFRSYNFKILEPKIKLEIHLDNHLSVDNILDYPEIESFAKTIIEKEDERCRFAYSTLISIYLLNGSKDKIELALKFSRNLADDIDSTRKTYWEWVRQNILSDFSVYELS